MKDRLGDKIRLQHIIDAIQEIDNYVYMVDYEQFSNNSMMLKACMMQLTIVGEATTRLSDSIIQENPHLPWKNMKGLRNIVVHEYFSVDNKIIWDIIVDNLPPLKIQIANILTSL